MDVRVVPLFIFLCEKNSCKRSKLPTCHLKAPWTEVRLFTFSRSH